MDKLMGEPRFAQIWEEALQEFQKETEVNLVSNKSLPQAKSVDELIEYLRARHEEFQHDTASSSKCITYLRVAFGPFKLLNNTLGGASGAIFPPSTQILGAVSVLIEAAKNTTKSFEAVSGLFEEMSSFGERLKELCQVEIPEAMHPILVRMLVITLKVLALATKRSKHPEDAQTRHHKRDRLVTLFKSNASQYLRQLFMGEDTEISAAIDALKKVVKEEHRMAATSTLKNTQVISKTTTSIMKSTDSINETTALTWKGYNELHQEFTQFSHVVLERLPEYASKEAKKRRDHSLGTSMKSDAAKGAEKSKRLKSILLPYAGYATVLGCLQRRVPTTTDGLMKETPVKDWLDRKIQVLHLVGGTGYGKTFAAGRIVDELQNRVKQQLGAEKASINTARMLTAYYFNTDENADVRKMLRTLAFQIASGNPAYFQHVDRVNKKETIRNLDVDRLWGVLFTEYFKETKSPAYLVLDGIDQLPVDEREQLLTCLGKKQAPGSTLAAGIQLMLVTGLSSRERLEALFGDSRAVIGPDIEHDFPTFVRTNLRTAWAKRFITNNLFSVTVKEIVAASRGNYLQASLIIDEVASLSREQDVRKAIDTLPKTLTEAAPLVFDRLKRQLGPEDQQDLTDIIGWVASSKRPLSLAELDAFLTLRQPEGARVLDLEDQLRRRYASLFVLPENKDTKSSSEERLAQRLTENERLYISAQKLLRNEVSGNDQTSAQPLCVEQASSKYLNETTIRIEHRLLANHFHMGSTQDIIAEQTFDAMKLNSLLACLDILCGGSTILQEARKKAWPYCTAYIVEHLKDINPTKAPPEKRLDVVRRLLQLFRDPVTIAQWLEPEEFYTATNFPSDSHFIRSFVTWISDEFIQSSVSPQDLGWIQNALDAPHKNILAHFALGHANRWLKAMSKLDNLDSTFVVINSYLDLSGILPLDPQESNEAPKLYTLEDSSPERIIETAKWAGFEQDARWMARLGRALLTAEHLDTAIEYYQRSIELDPNDGLVHAVLSFVFNLKNEYLNAIASSYRAMELFKKDIEANRSPSDPSLDNLSSLILRYKYLAELQKEIGQTEQAIKNYALALGQWTEEEVPNWPRRAWSFAFCFKELVMLGQYDCACKQLERFNSHPKRLDEDYMVIYDEMVIYNSTMERVGYGTRRPDLVDAFYANAIWTYAKYGEDYEVLALRYDRAKTILKLDSNKRQEAEGLFLEVIGREIIEDMPSFWGAYARNNAEKALGVIYLDNTLQAREDDDWIAVGKFAHKLVELVKDSQARRAANGGNPSDCVLILAAWARTHNRPGRTRELVREHLSLGVEMLSDDDENNDVEAWTYLCTALLVLGDNQLAQTALSAQLRLQLKDAITTTNEKHDAAEAGQTTDTTSENTLPVTYYWCDGPCFKGIPVQDRFYRCSYCVADLCLACYDKLMKDEMEGWHVCSKLHEQFLFDGVSEVYDANMVKVGDDLVPLSKWLDDLKVYYGLVEHGAKDGGHEGGQ